MTNSEENVNQLLEKLDSLLKRQDEFYKEIDHLRGEISKLTTSSTEAEAHKEHSQPAAININHDPIVQHEKSKTTNLHAQQKRQVNIKLATPAATNLPKVKSNLEKFIGENLINKIGIAITVIGVAIGAKYAIDKQLISPLTRIILGYIAGAALLGFGMVLKRKYASFSAVLVSGSMAIMYFITYTAYSYYDLLSQTAAFVLMLVLTVFTVFAATTYNKQVIAQIGLVGAYAVPFLLSEGSGKVAILFTYMSIINAGILVIAFKKYWKPLYYVSFGLTWLIYFSWYVAKYQTNEHFGLAFIFLCIFFATFYLMFLAYKLIRKEMFEIGDIILLLANSFIFYGIGYSILGDSISGSNLLGFFSLCNAIVHFLVSGMFYRQKLSDRNLFYLVSGLVLVFITMAIPVQLDGNWVTLLWAGEATLLFWIGRTKNAPVYEKLSFILMLLAFISLVHDWTTVYGNYLPEAPASRLTPVLNINFLTSLLFIAAFGYINLLHYSKKYSSQVPQQGLSGLSSYFIPGILLFTIYYTFRIEISNYWDQLYADSLLSNTVGGQQGTTNEGDAELVGFKTIWIINYSLLYVSLLGFVNFWKIRSRQLGIISLTLIALVLAAFLTQGLFSLSELRENYFNERVAKSNSGGSMSTWIRYVSFAFVALSLTTFYRYLKQDFLQKNFTVAFDFMLHISVLSIASSEIINWMDIAGSTQTHKLGLSILWGIYALLLISLGIGKKKKHLRIGAIALFAVTLVKLFFYDISHFDTLAKTVVFVSLGILLLIISFLYNKYAHLISEEGSH